MKRLGLVLLLASCGPTYSDDGGCPEPYSGLFTADDGRTALVSEDSVILTHPDGTEERLYFVGSRSPRPVPKVCTEPQSEPRPADGFRDVRLQPGSRAALGTIWLDAIEGATILEHDVDLRFAEPHPDHRFTVTATTTRVAIAYATGAPTEAEVTLQHVLRLPDSSTIAETLELSLVPEGNVGVQLLGLDPCP